MNMSPVSQHYHPQHYHYHSQFYSNPTLFSHPHSPSPGSYSDSSLSPESDGGSSTFASPYSPTFSSSVGGASSSKDPRLNPAPENTRSNFYVAPRIQPQRSYHSSETSLICGAGSLLNHGGRSGHMGGWHPQDPYHSRLPVNYQHQGGHPGEATLPTILSKLGIDEDTLTVTPVKDLNKTLKVAKGITRQDIKQIKERRRTVKNRGYAHQCRVKRENEARDLEEEISRLDREAIEIDNENLTTEDEIKKLHTCIESLKRLKRTHREGGTVHPTN